MFKVNNQDTFAHTLLDMCTHAHTHTHTHKHSMVNVALNMFIVKGTLMQI